MQHPDSIFTDPSYAEYGLESLGVEFDQWLRGRAKPVKAITRRKYTYSLNALFGHMKASGTPLTLRNLHHSTVEAWIADCRAAGQSEDGLASTLAAIKAFANSFITRHAELCIADPLRKVARIEPPDKEMPVLDESEIEALLASYGDVTYEDVRNRAFVATLVSTGARLREARELTMTQWDAVSGEMTLHGKNTRGGGDKIRYVKLSDRTLKYVKHYLRMRPRNTSDAFWLTREGYPVGEAGWNTVFRKLKRKSGIERVHAHLLRHTFGSHAIRAGAERAAVQDMLGHEDDRMTRRYTRDARRRTAAAMMPKYSPI
jgi:site-specific recombinase XerD